MWKPLAAVVAITLLGAIPSAEAATAHNSQAGAFGSNSNACEATPYFRDGGCLSSFIQSQIDGGALPPPARYYRNGRRPPVDQDTD